MSHNTLATSTDDVSSAALRFRPVQAGDKDRVLAFTRNTWGEDDSDYIAEVFDDWLIDPRGEFTAVEVNGQVAAIAKLTDLGDDEWWFEGLRVDPAFRRRGIALALNRYQVELARRLGGRVIRYMTGHENTASQTIGARAGFQHILTFVAYLAEARRDLEPPPRLTADDLPALTRWIDSPLMRYQHGAFRDAWSVRTLTPRELQAAVEQERVYGLKDAAGNVDAYAVMRPYEYDDDSEDAARHRLRVDHLDGEQAAVAELADRVRALAAARGRHEVSAGISDYPPLVETIKAAGYVINPEHFGLWVLELKL